VNSAPPNEEPGNQNQFLKRITLVEHCRGFFLEGVTIATFCMTTGLGAKGIADIVILG
jgi:hypothetical protein